MAAMEGNVLFMGFESAPGLKALDLKSSKAARIGKRCGKESKSVKGDRRNGGNK
jgi:hypothetical protein